MLVLCVFHICLYIWDGESCLHLILKLFISYRSFYYCFNLQLLAVHGYIMGILIGSTKFTAQIWSIQWLAGIVSFEVVSYDIPGVQASLARVLRGRRCRKLRSWHLFLVGLFLTVERLYVVYFVNSSFFNFNLSSDFHCT